MLLPEDAGQRRKLLRATRLQAVGVEDRSILRCSAVGPGTLTNYLNMIDRFDSFLRRSYHRKLIEIDVMSHLDLALSDFVTKLFWEGEAAHTATLALAALGWKYPQYSKHGALALPFSRQAIGGFLKLSPSRTRLPLPVGVMALISYYLVKMRMRRSAMLLWLALTAYLRPGEMSLITAQQLIAPSRGGSTQYLCDPYDAFNP